MRYLTFFVLLIPHLIFSQTTGFFGGDPSVSGYPSGSNTSGKWLKLGSMVLNGNWNRGSIMVDFYPRQAPHGDSRQTLIINLGNNTTGVDEVNQDIALIHHYGVSRSILSVKVIHTSGSGVSNNAMSIWVQMGGSYIQHIPIEVRTYGTVSVETTNQPYFESIQESGVMYDAKVTYGMIGTQYYMTSNTSGDMVLKLESDKDNNQEADNTWIEMFQDGGSSGAYIGFNKDWGGGTPGSAGLDPDNLFRIGTRYAGVSNYDRLVINGSNGNVGIGTTSPVKRLDVNGDARIGSLNSRRYLKISSSEWPEVRFETPNSNEQIRIGVAHSNSSSYQISEGDFYVYTQTVNKMPLMVQRDSDVILNSNSGNTGIGTTTPTHKLEVNGTIRSKEVKVEASPWPDYVFEPNYNLLSLEEIEAFIKSEKHLPEIPSAKEMEANGLMLGEMNMILLKKIEELTLHLIEVNKENTELRQQQTVNSQGLTSNTQHLATNTQNQKVLSLRILELEKKLEEQGKLIEKLNIYITNNPKD